MIYKVSNLVLNNISDEISVAVGLAIFKAGPIDTIKIADILWDPGIDTCYIKTVADNFQNYIVTYDDFKNFVQVVDEAFLLISKANNKKGLY